MSNNFLILGLPRSRTAWLANFLTYDGFHCMHEGANGCTTVDEYIAKFKCNTGDATTGAMLFHNVGYFNNLKTVIVDSSIEAAEEYGKQIGVEAKELLLNTKAYLDVLPGLHVPFEELNEYLPAIWNYCTNNAPYDEERTEMLKGLDIQVRQPYDFNVEAAKLFMEDMNSER